MEEVCYFHIHSGQVRTILSAPPDKKGGAERYGFYVSTNEFNNAGTAFNGAQLDAISKEELIKAAKIRPSSAFSTSCTQ